MGRISRLLPRRQQKKIQIVTPNTAEILDYIKVSTVSAQVGRRCVDGRYLPNQAAGMIARPGGDCGYVMALIAVNKKKKLGMTPEQCFNAIYKAVEQYHGFCMHTDHHTDPNSHTHVGLIGCGHLAKAAAKNHAKEYDVNSEDIRKIVDYARNVCDITNTVHMVNLQGDHQEKGVLIVQSSEYSVMADNPEVGKMYFIYDKQRDIEFIKKLVKDLAIPQVSYEDMKRESDLQLQATLYNLAMGLPMYTITYNGKEPAVSYIGNIERESARSTYSARFHFPKAFLPVVQKIVNRN